MKIKSILVAILLFPISLFGATNAFDNVKINNSLKVAGILYPLVDGTSNQVFTTFGNGTAGFVTVAGSGDVITTANNTFVVNRTNTFNGFVTTSNLTVRGTLLGLGPVLFSNANFTVVNEIDGANSTLLDTTGVGSVFFNSRILTDNALNGSVDWQNRLLINSAGNVVNYSGNPVLGLTPWTFNKNVIILSNLTSQATNILSGLRYPLADGTTNQVMTTFGNGTLGFTTVISAANTITNIANVGTGTSIISGVVGNTVNVKTISAGTGITLTGDTSNIIINATGAGGGNVSTNLNQTYVVGTTQAFDVISWNRALKPVASQITSSATITANRNTAEVFWVNLTNAATLATPTNMRAGESVKIYMKAVNVSNVVTLASGLTNGIPASSTLLSPFSIVTNTTTIISIGFIGTNYTIEAYVPGYSIPPIP